MTTHEGPVLNLGGGGLSMPEVAGGRGPLLDDFLRSLTGKSRPKACFMGTTSGDDATHLEKVHAAFEGRAETTAPALFTNGRRGRSRSTSSRGSSSRTSSRRWPNDPTD